MRTKRPSFPYSAVLLAGLFTLLCSARILAQLNPADYGNITLHLRADALGLANNAPVTSWGGLTASGTEAPTHLLSDARFNNKPVVRFDGSGNVMKRLGANLEARTIFAVVTSESGAPSNSTLLSTGADSLNLRRNGTGTTYLATDNKDFAGVPTPRGSVFVNNIANGSFTAGTPHIVLAVAGANQNYFHLWLGNAGLSGTTALNQQWNGSVAEIIVYDQALTPAAINAVGWHLKTKYGLTAPTYTQPPPIVNSFSGSTTETSGQAGLVSTAGAPVNLIWNVANASSVSISNGAQSTTPATTGSVVVSPTASTTYTLTATNPAGSVTKNFFVGIGAAPQDFRLSELMADNGGVLRDEDGDSSDWIEIFNPNPFDHSLEGWKLVFGTYVWSFPAARVPGNGHFVVFASGKNRTNPAATLHTNFNLPLAGGTLQLLAPDGATKGALTYGPQRETHSHGLTLGPPSVTHLLPVSQPGILRYHLPTAATPWTWMQPAFDASTWTSVNATSIGFDADYAGATSYVPYFSVDLGSASVAAPSLPASNPMYNKASTLCARYTFNVADTSSFTGLRLRIRYEDGFVAWLNGVEIARGNFSGTPAFNSTTGARSESLAIQLEEFDVTTLGLPALASGNNVLAILGVNGSTTSNDFLIAPLLEGVATQTLPLLMIPTPGATNGSGVLGFVGDTNFSVKRGVYTTPQTVAITTTTPGATIRYTTDGSTPTETTGTVYTAPLTISTQTTLRARAFLTGHVPSNTDTQTYVFPAAVLNQGNTPPSGWPASGTSTNGQTMRYGMNTTLKAQYTDAQIIAGLTSLPSVSLVTDLPHLFDATSGIYVNTDMRGGAWERPASLELIHPDGTTPGFNIGCGIRIRGGASRQDRFPKHGFQVYFRKEYGAGSLKYPLFGDTGAQEFQIISLRTEQNYNWSSNASGTQNTAVREVFCRDLFRAMGQPSANSRSFHLYLNGHYWGLFMWDERKQEDFAASYLGGNASDYDVAQTTGSSAGYIFEIGSGQIDAWQNTWNLARACADNPTNANYFALLGRNASGVRQPSLPVYVDPEALATYMLLYYYTGDGDSPLSISFLQGNRGNNWRGARSRLDDKGWRFFPHDCEHTVTATSWRSDRTAGTTGGSNRANFIYSNPEWLHEDLAANAEYRLKIADVAQKHLLNGGVLTQARAQALFDARAAEIDQAIVADVVRWGQSATDHTKAQWLSRLDTIRTSFFPTRADTVLTQLKARGFYPNVNPPAFSRRGGLVAPGSTFSLSNGGQSGTMYYTTDGTDPRLVGGAVSPTAFTYASPVAVTSRTQIRTRFRSSGGVWSALDEASFTVHPAASASNLVISKIHYHTANPSAGENPSGLLTDTDFEYVELLNKGDATLDLTGVAFDQGITFSFTASDITTLAPGARVLVVSNPAAFAARHGTGLPVAGAYTGSLVNSGETVRLLDASGAAISVVPYDDVLPWPVLADGFGPALVLTSPTANPSAATNWRASSVPGGVPGGEDVWTPTLWRSLTFTAAEAADPLVSGGAADPDGDGWSNLMEFALGSSPKQPGERPLLTFAAGAPGQPALSLTARVRDNLGGGVTLVVEGSGDLLQWSANGITQGTPVPQPDGTFLITWQDASAAAHRFLRLRVVEP